MVQLARVRVPSKLSKPPPLMREELPLRLQSFSVVVPPRLYRPPPLRAVLPLTVQPDSASVPPWLYSPPPFPGVEPPVMPSPEIDAVTNGSTWKTRLRPPPLSVTP